VAALAAGGWKPRVTKGAKSIGDNSIRDDGHHPREKHRVRKVRVSATKVAQSRLTSRTSQTAGRTTVEAGGCLLNDAE